MKRNLVSKTLKECSLYNFQKAGFAVDNKSKGTKDTIKLISKKLRLAVIIIGENNERKKKIIILDYDFYVKFYRQRSVDITSSEYPQSYSRIEGFKVGKKIHDQVYEFNSKNDNFVILFNNKAIEVDHILHNNDFILPFVLRAATRNQNLANMERKTGWGITKEGGKYQLKTHFDCTGKRNKVKEIADKYDIKITILPETKDNEEERDSLGNLLPSIANVTAKNLNSRDEANKLLVSLYYAVYGEFIYNPLLDFSHEDGFKYLVNYYIFQTISENEVISLNNEKIRNKKNRQLESYMKALIDILGNKAYKMPVIQ